MKKYLPKLLITGGAGQMAQALRFHADAANFNLIILPRNQLDIANSAQIQNAIETYRPTIIINTAAYTNVDLAETDRHIAAQINHEGAKQLAIACHQFGISLIHLSTDYIFNGNTRKAYREDESVQPINFYGMSKWLGEEAIREHCAQHVILRVSGIFSAYGKNFVKTIRRAADESNELKVVSDQITCPTSADHIAGALFKIAQDIHHTGTYHFCSSNPTSWFEFAKAVLKDKKVNITPILSAESARPALRPLYSVLDCQKLAVDYGLEQPDWMEKIGI